MTGIGLDFNIHVDAALRSLTRATYFTLDVEKAFDVIQDLAYRVIPGWPEKTTKE